MVAQPSIYKLNDNSWKDLNGNFKSIDAVAIKYGTNFDSYLSATYHEKGGLLIIGGSVNIKNSFTPYYDNTDEYGSSGWPCLMTIDLTNEDFKIEDGYYGILERDKTIYSDVRIGCYNNHITIATRDGVNIPSGWPILSNSPIFKMPRV